MRISTKTRRRRDLSAPARVLSWLVALIQNQLLHAARLHLKMCTSQTHKRYTSHNTITHHKNIVYGLHCAHVC